MSTDPSATYTLNFADVTGEKEVLLSGAVISAKGTDAAKTANGTATATFSNITLGTVVGLENSSVTAVSGGATTDGTATATVSFGFAAATGAADAVTLKLADVTMSATGVAAKSATVDIDSIENLTINSIAGTDAAVTSNTLILDGNSYETITVTGSQALTLTATAAAQAALKTFDASAMTANTTVTLAANVDLTIKGGTKNDTVNVTAGTKKVVVEAGEGNDTINVTNANANKLITLSGGAGNDVFGFSADLDNVEDVTNDSKILENIIKITDWNAGDKIDITTLADLTTITDTQRDAITAKTTLKAAIEQAATHTAGGDQIVWFTWSGNTYIYQDSATAGFAAGDDGLIQIAGVHTLATTDFM